MIPQITLTYNEGVSIFVQIGVFAILYYVYNLFIDKKNVLIVIYMVSFIALWLFLINISNSIVSFLSFPLPLDIYENKLLSKTKYYI
tara:strand:- start:189 stop:449 length:261 start_codon:yes stop_codon:yes gene_type:complete